MTEKGENKVLVVDLDNSLVRIDVFKEMLLRLLFISPFNFIIAIIKLIKSKAESKDYCSKLFDDDPSLYPYNDKVLEIINDYKEKGFTIVLSTGAPTKQALAISSHLGKFDKVIGTDKDFNNIGFNKIEKLKKEIGNNFIYLGDSKIDCIIWKSCQKAILVGKKPSIIRFMELNKVELLQLVPTPNNKVSKILKMIRVHQWTKNLIVFIPALTSHKIFDAKVFNSAFITVIAFSLIASSVYLINDIVDVFNDRAHNRKKNRPIASGNVSVPLIIFTLITLISLSTFIVTDYLSSLVSVIVLYLVLNFIYSMRLKRVIILDLILLSSFYIIRLVAGFIPSSIPLSVWLISFSIFIFFSLSILKRYSDTLIHNKNKVIPGRGYHINDASFLLNLGISSGLMSAVVLLLYTTSEQVKKLYESPVLLLLITPVILYWISRLWLIASRGTILHDPVLFAIKDKVTYYVVISLLCIMVASKTLKF